MNITNRFARSILLIYGFGWLLGGIVYLYAGIIAPIFYLPSTHYTAEVAVQFMQNLKPYWFYYALAFIIFTLADTAMMLLGLVFRRVFGVTFNTSTAAFCIFAGGFIGVFVDLSLLTCWLLIGTFHLTPELLQGFWSVFLVVQYLGVILSAWGFLIGGVGIYLIYKASQQSTLVTNAWRKWTLVVFWLCLFNVLAIIFAILTNNGLPTALLFLFFTVVAVPVWTFMLSRNPVLK